MLLRSIASLAFCALVLMSFSSRASAQAAYAAEYLGRSFPEASEKLTLTVGETREGYFEFTNTGTATWSTMTTKLATIPRDAKSPLADDSWENEGRCTAVDEETAPGEVGRFTFTIRANEPGDYLYAFGLLEEWVTWFADDGGPPDNSVFVRVRVIEPPPPTATVSTGAATSSTSGAGGEGGAGGGGGAGNEPGDSDGGCDCSVNGRRAGASSAMVTVLALGLILGRRRRACARVAF